MNIHRLTRTAAVWAVVFMASVTLVSAPAKATTVVIDDVALAGITGLAAPPEFGFFAGPPLMSNSPPVSPGEESRAIAIFDAIPGVPALLPGFTTATLELDVGEEFGEVYDVFAYTRDGSLPSSVELADFSFLSCGPACGELGPLGPPPGPIASFDIPDFGDPGFPAPFPLTIAIPFTDRLTFALASGLPSLGIRIQIAGGLASAPSLGFFEDARIILDDGAVIPVPAALPLLLTGLAGLGLIGWRRRKAA